MDTAATSHRAPSRKAFIVAGLTVLGLAVVACTDTGGSGDSSPTSTTTTSAPATTVVGDGLPAAITCKTQYRPDASSVSGAVEDEVDVSKPSRATTASGHVTYDAMTLEVGYDFDPESGSQSVSVVVTDAHDAELLRVLYQLPDDSTHLSEYSGGSGFTGLHYVNSGAAQLQFWCEAAFPA